MSALQDVAFLIERAMEHVDSDQDRSIKHARGNLNEVVHRMRFVRLVLEADKKLKRRRKDEARDLLVLALKELARMGIRVDYRERGN